MFGVNMGTLNFDISVDGGTEWTTKWTLSGNQGTGWYEATVPLNPSTSHVRFSATTGTGYRSDVAIDDVQIIVSTAAPLASLKILSIC